MLYRFAKSILKRLPKTRWGDAWVAYFYFILIYRRRPKVKGGGFYDATYALKATHELRTPLRGFISDKEYLKLYVKAKIGDQYNVPTLAILKGRTQSELIDTVRSFDFPVPSIIKPTHMSGEVVHHTGELALPIEAIIGWCTRSFYDKWREPNYRYLIPKVIIEPVVFGIESITEMVEYKHFCVWGESKVIQTGSGRGECYYKAFYTHQWQELDITLSAPKRLEGYPRPKALENMLELCKVLGEDFSLMRIDFYAMGDTVYVSELTNLHGAGMSKFGSPSEEKLMNERLFGPKGFMQQAWNFQQ